MMNTAPCATRAPPAMSVRRSYDHRFRQAICETGDTRMFDSVVPIPRSTAKSWIRRGRANIVSLDEGEFEVVELRERVAKLARQIEKHRRTTRILVAVIRLQRTELNTSGFSFENQRIPEAAAKARVVAAITHATTILPLVIVLRLLRLSSARFHAWMRAQTECGLADRSSCPKTFPSQLTADEMMAMKQRVTSEAYRHMPITTLALFAQRVGKVFASASTWSKKVRERGWRRPRKRVYPAKPKVGIRASAPNQIWHLDVTVIRLLDGTQVFLHGVIDNFSRRILAWRICDKLDPMTTVSMLREAAGHIGITPLLVADSGVENVNSDVDALIEAGVIRRVLALVEVTYSNSIIEAYWRSLKHQWLFLNSLDNLRALDKLVAFHVEQHNRVMPHSACRGRTPDEVYFATGERVPDELAVARARARQQRLAANRALSCSACAAESPVKSPELQLRRSDS